MSEVFDLGHGVTIEYTSWADHEKVGLLRTHPKPDGTTCTSGLLFDLAGVREAFPDRALWQVEQWDPLTLSPSLLCRECQHHGWIRAGRWVPA
jgi:hypothetical protein